MISIEQMKKQDIMEIHNLVALIGEEAILLLEKILSDESEKEATEILNNFDEMIKAQAFGTLNNLVTYQIVGWRELLYESED